MTKNYKIRKFKIDDFDSLFKLLYQNFGIIANKMDIFLGLILSRGLVYILSIDEKIIGSIFFLKILDTAYIYNGCIDKKYQNKKISQDFLTTDLYKICKENGIKLIIMGILENNKMCQSAVNHIGMKYSDFKVNIPFQGRSYILYKWI